ncbi:hypothetical protein RWE87_04935 [Sinorhizobium meliloti]|uniref:hypothetical protein n=1 Tax=Rhizobium meliloti TaxID=382 RepID=UPI00299E6C41|nr:hypothetical protein [Sinorhizobium meliloti]
MKRLLAAAVACLVLAGCEETKYPKYAVNQQERQRIFKECLASLPEGPRTTTYSDWDEVVSECDTIAFEQARYCYENCAPPRKFTNE